MPVTLQVLFAPLDVELGPDTVVQPDIVVVLELDGDDYREVGVATPGAPLTVTAPAALTLWPQ